MNSELIQKYGRIFIYIVIGSLAEHGLINKDASWIEPVVAGLLFLANVAWTIYGSRLSGLLAQVQAKDGVIKTDVIVDPAKIDPHAVNKETPTGVTATT